ncbi:MAG: universal stress protein [Acidimicrobiales bacterium]
MSTVLATLDATAAGRPVLETALRVGELTATSVRVLHVRSDPRQSSETPESLARRSGVAFELLEGKVDQALLSGIENPDVVAVVIGARATPGGRRPVGHTAQFILEHADKPIVVVPPDTAAPPALRRLLVPLEGTEQSSRPILQGLWPLLVADVELVVLHVFTDLTLPAMLDRPRYDLEILGREFLHRHFRRGRGIDIELRPGPVASRVIEVSRERGADLIVLSWSRSSAPGTARVIREVISTATLPVLLLPAAPDSDPMSSEVSRSIVSS